jgi:hypothetical protein
MLQRFRSDLVSWLHLAIVLLAALSPAQAMVVCVEPGGSMQLETSAEGRCSSCDDDRTAPSSELRHETDCSCLDIPLPRSGAVVRSHVLPVLDAIDCAHSATVLSTAHVVPLGDLSGPCSRAALGFFPAAVDLARTSVLLI